MIKTNNEEEQLKLLNAAAKALSNEPNENGRTAAIIGCELFDGYIAFTIQPAVGETFGVTTGVKL